MTPKVEKSQSKRARTEGGSSSHNPPQANVPFWPRAENTPFEIQREFADPPRKVLTSRDVDDRITSDEWDDYNSLLYNQWLRVPLAPARYDCVITKSMLRIKDELPKLLQKVGLEHFVSRDDDLYPDLVRQFFASVRLYNTAENEEQKKDPNRWFMSFMANGVRYGVSARVVCKIYQFPDYRVAGELPADIEGGVQTLWSRIGVGRYDVSTSKHTDVRHPVIRYLIRLFSTSILCKLEPGKMRKHELVLLSYALRDVVPNATWAEYHPNMGMVFMQHLHSLRHTPLNIGKVGHKQFTAGAWLTPLFELCKVDMSPYTRDRTVLRIDIEYMTRCGWLKNDYHWIFSVALGQQRQVQLPLPELMPVSENPDLLFFEPDERLVHQVEPSRKQIIRGTGGASTSRASTSRASASQLPPQPRAQPHQHVFPSPPRCEQTEHEKWVTRALKATWDAMACMSGCVRPRSPSPSRQASPEPAVDEED